MSLHVLYCLGQTVSSMNILPNLYPAQLIGTKLPASQSTARADNSLASYTPNITLWVCSKPRIKPAAMQIC